MNKRYVSYITAFLFRYQVRGGVKIFETVPRVPNYLSDVFRGSTILGGATWGPTRDQFSTIFEGVPMGSRGSRLWGPVNGIPLDYDAEFSRNSRTCNPLGVIYLIHHAQPPPPSQAQLYNGNFESSNIIFQNQSPPL